MCSQPTPVLPIEVIANIAGFVAGDNDYAGLAAMSLTSHTMQQELKPILYETVTWNPQFHERMHRIPSRVGHLRIPPC